MATFHTAEGRGADGLPERDAGSVRVSGGRAPAQLPRGHRRHAVGRLRVLALGLGSRVPPRRIALRKPPPWSPECDLDATAASGHAPRIVSPQPTLTYHAAATPNEDGSILFAATTDADAQRLFWFVNGALVAEVGRHEHYFWTPRSGRFSVRAADDLGRAATVTLRVAGLAERHG